MAQEGGDVSGKRQKKKYREKITRKTKVKPPKKTVPPPPLSPDIQ